MLIRFKGDETPVVINASYATESVPVKFSYGMRQPVTLAFYHDDKSPFTEAQLLAYVSWQFGIDNDFNLATDPAILTVTGFVVSGNTLTFIVATGTPKAYTLLNNQPSVKLNAQLDGFVAGNPLSAFRVQFQVNLLGSVIADGSTPPEENPELYASMAQIEALLAVKPDLAGTSVALLAADTTDVIIGIGSRYLLDVSIKDAAGHYWNRLCYLTKSGSTAYLTPMIGDASPVALSNFDPADGIDASLVDGALVLSVTLAAGDDLTFTYNVLTKN